jgi:hypothetical protein
VRKAERSGLEVEVDRPSVTTTSIRNMHHASIRYHTLLDTSNAGSAFVGGAKHCRRSWISMGPEAV